MSFRFFIDECLSPHLVVTAINARHEATCARDRGLLGMPDWRLLPKLLTDGYVLVTRNARDFRGHGFQNPGGLYAKLDIHPGLICLNSYRQLGIADEERLFLCALDHLAPLPDFINRALEVTQCEGGDLVVDVYEIAFSPIPL